MGCFRGIPTLGYPSIPLKDLLQNLKGFRTGSAYACCLNGKEDPKVESRSQSFETSHFLEIVRCGCFCNLLLCSEDKPHRKTSQPPRETSQPPSNPLPPISTLTSFFKKHPYHLSSLCLSLVVVYLNLARTEASRSCSFFALKTPL